MRLTWWVPALAALAVALAALAVGLAIVWRAGDDAIASQQTEIAISAADYFSAFAKEDGVAALAAALNRREAAGAPDGFRYGLIDNAGRVLGGADVVASLDAPPSGWRTVTSPDDSPSRLWRVLARPIGGGRTLIVAEDLRARRDFQGALLKASAVALMITIAAVAAVGLAFNVILLRRARAIAATAEAIAAGDLSARAPVRTNGDVFDALGASLNAMLDRIDALMTGLRTVTDSLAHDLRSPLGRLRMSLETAVDPGAEEPARQAALDRAFRETDQALATLTALSDVARAESGLSRAFMTTLDLAALAEEMGELFTPVAEDAGQSLTLDLPQGPLCVSAHPQLLRQAVGNLLHNATLYAGSGAAIRLDVRLADDGHARLCVRDNGPGVPAEHLGRVQERFVRLDESRHAPGTGLGLAIATACAKLHGGRLVLRDAHPGLEARLEMPLDGGATADLAA